MLRSALTYPAIFILWLLHSPPPPMLAPVGRGFGRLLYVVGSPRRRVVTINLEWCFPDLSPAERKQLAIEHFQALGRSLLERGLLWWSSKERLDRLIRVEGADKIRSLLDAGTPVMLLAPHFLALDAGGVGIAMRFDSVSIYAAQTNPLIDKLLLRGRNRFGNQQLLSRQDGVRATVRAMKAGRPFSHLPDLNARRQGPFFVPFFGHATATITGLPRLSRAAGAKVLSCVTRMLPDGQGYVVEIGDAWENFPTEDAEADTARMNRWIEEKILTMPGQYYWVHRRFKTRPEGEKRPY